MKKRRVPILGACLVAALAVASDPSSDAVWGVVHAAGSRTVAAKPGEVASGAIVFENPNEVRVSVDPCHAGDVIVFYAPFVKVKLGRGDCGNQPFERFQLEKE